MQIIINRTEQTKSAIGGSLHINGQHICDTAKITSQPYQQVSTISSVTTATSTNASCQSFND